MTDQTQILDSYRRYAGLIRSLIRSAQPFMPDSESTTAVQVERGIVFPMAMLDPVECDRSSVGRLIELSNLDRLPRVAVIDSSGHHRPVYRAALVYSWLQAFSTVYETLPRSEFGQWEEGLRPWCDLMEAELGEIEWPAGPMPASRGASATESAWMALSLHVAGKLFIRDAWTDLASHTFGRLAQARTSHGPFLTVTPSDNPETHWYHELVLLHAAASYAVQAEDRPLAAIVRATSLHHFAETQPDHATPQPWALFPFIWNPASHPVADQILHTSQINPTPLSLMLLADALYCLELFLK